ncbi:hypothetical protein E2562_015426 [Oryza meyeriana var. granulata]|uniref:Uncharacterized protein n=1 Tax=Oryza meyeriana var. granulata TaxID=110450 RepID=A0A6G1EK82_9ORYZ|nr:hypothetical protein E2562_015426 [Oryza meyeriana var. granulata]
MTGEENKTKRLLLPHLPPHNGLWRPTQSSKRGCFGGTSGDGDLRGVDGECRRQMNHGVGLSLLLSPRGGDAGGRRRHMDLGVRLTLLLPPRSSAAVPSGERPRLRRSERSSYSGGGDSGGGGGRGRSTRAQPSSGGGGGGAGERSSGSTGKRSTSPIAMEEAQL